MKERLFQARKNFNDVLLNAQPIREWQGYWYKCLLQWTLQIQEEEEVYIVQKGRLLKHNKKFSSKPILFLYCVAHVVPHLTTAPVTSPGTNSPIKFLLSKDHMA